MFSGSPLLDDAGLLQNLHGKELAGVATGPLPDQKHFAVGWNVVKRLSLNGAMEINRIENSPRAGVLGGPGGAACPPVRA